MQRTYKTAVGIHSHKWTQEQLLIQNFDAKSFEDSFIQFNAIIPTVLQNIRIGDQQNFDYMMHEMFGNVQELPFLEDITMAASIAFSKASAYCEGVHTYEFLLKQTGFNVIERPSILFDMVAGSNETDLVKYISIEAYKTPSCEVDVNWATKIFKKFQLKFREQHHIDPRLTTPVTQSGCVLLDFQTTNQYFAELWTVMKDESTFNLIVPKKTRFKLYLHANATSLWSGNSYRVDGEPIQNDRLFEKYEILQMSYDFTYIANPFIDSSDIYKKKCTMFKFVKPYKTQKTKSISFFSICNK
uniref:Uncharacterized protein n=1 Tax=Panagrolaimus superbus TaxID=310955 RepID=A0A914YV97_9BILA